MRYDDFRRSDDIEDRRGEEGGGMGGGGLGIPMGGGGLGIGTIIVLGLLGYAFGIDPRILIGGAEILTGGGGRAPTYETDRPSGQRKAGAPTDEMGSMIAGVLGEIDDRWNEIFQADGRSYTGPKIVLFRNATNGGRCGMAQSAMGPFYCPPDRTIFLDTAFFREVETRFRGCSGSACKFTAAYIIAHDHGRERARVLVNAMGALDRDVTSPGQSPLIRDLVRQGLMRPYMLDGRPDKGADIDMATLRLPAAHNIYVANMLLWGPGFFTSSAFLMATFVSRILATMFADET